MRQAPASATSASAAAPHRISRRLANARSPRRRRFSESAGEILPARAERRRVGMSWSEAGGEGKEGAGRETDPPPPQKPRAPMAGERVTPERPDTPTGGAGATS